MLSKADAAFIRRFTSMSVAARDANMRPQAGRALGCRISADRRRLTIFLSAGRAAKLLECLRDNGAIALAITRPSTNESLQLKGKVIEIAALSGDDSSEIAAYRESFAQELGSLGYASELAHGILAGGDDCVAVVFEPAAMFNQTPGPKAGTKLEGRR